MDRNPRKHKETDPAQAVKGAGIRKNVPQGTLDGRKPDL